MQRFFGRKAVKMQHSFDIDIATEYGVNAAVILNNIAFWIKQNEANETNFYDGNYWTFNSRRAYLELFPYMSKRQIDTAFQKLIDSGLIITGNYNKLAYDRTLWYALSKKGKCILHFGTMDNIKMSNALSQNVQPIPDINTDINAVVNTDNKKGATSSSIQLVTEILDYLNMRAGTKYRADTRKTQDLIKARLKEGFSVQDFRTVIEKKCVEWVGTEWEKFLRPETLFGTKFESYLNAKVIKKSDKSSNVFAEMLQEETAKNDLF